MGALYPLIEPYESGTLDVGDGKRAAGVGHSAGGAMSELGVDALDRFAAL